MSAVGIDTLWLRPTETVLRRNHGLTVYEPPTVRGVSMGCPATFRYEDGGTFQTGRLEYKVANSMAQVSTTRGALGIQFSIPKVNAGGADNVEPTTQAEAFGVIDKVGQWLADELGVITDLRKATVSRYDTFANAETKYPFQTFRPMFEAMEIKRQQRRDLGTTFSFENNQAKTVIYDKVVEQWEKHGNKLPHGNLVRWENRHIGGAKCRASLGAPDSLLTAAALIDCTHVFTDRYYSSVRDAIKPDVDADVPVAAAGIERRLRELQQRGHGNPTTRFLLQYGAERLYADLGGRIETFREILQRLPNYDRFKVRRDVGKFARSLDQMELALGGGLTIGELKRELYYKLAA